MKFLIGAGIALAGLVELVAWVLPDAIAKVASDPANGSGPGAAIVALLAFAVLLALAALANWLVWTGARTAAVSTQHS